MKRVSMMIAIVFLFVAVAGACEKGNAAEHQAHMKALFTKVSTSWEQVQNAATPAARETALKAHGDALAELKAAHEKHLAAAPEKKMDCKAMMEKMKAEGKECKMECCKDHKKSATAGGHS